MKKGWNNSESKQIIIRSKIDYNDSQNVKCFTASLEKGFYWFFDLNKHYWLVHLDHCKWGERERERKKMIPYLPQTIDFDINRREERKQEKADFDNFYFHISLQSTMI